MAAGVGRLEAVHLAAHPHLRRERGGHSPRDAGHQLADAEGVLGFEEGSLLLRSGHPDHPRRRVRQTELVVTRVAPGVLEIDTLLGGWERVTAGYLIEGPAPVLVETGSQSSVPALLAALESIGVSANELAGGGGPPHPLHHPRGGRRGGPPL